MGKILGQTEYEKFKAGQKLTRNQSIKALCYECNGFEEANHDCKAVHCPIYPYSPYRGKK